MKAAQVRLDAVVEIDVPDDVVRERVTGRRVHAGSGRVYHVKYNPPKVADHDDVTGEPLEQRADDTLEKVNTRLEKYHAETEPLIGYYAQWSASGDPQAPRCARISGMGSVDEITARALAALG
jgi:adenylate kinase